MKLRWILAIVLVFAMMVTAIGCTPKQQPPAQPAPQQPKAAMEDPKPIMSQMTQTVDQISSSAKANQWPQAKQAGATLASLDDRLAPHFTDTAFRDSMHHEIGILNDELNKASPNQAAVEKQVQKVRDLLKQAPSKIMTTH
jgi:hypothetical protein